MERDLVDIPPAIRGRLALYSHGFGNMSCRPRRCRPLASMM
jgi:hypothetical protein